MSFNAHSEKKNNVKMYYDVCNIFILNITLDINKYKYKYKYYIKFKEKSYKI